MSQSHPHTLQPLQHESVPAGWYTVYASDKLKKGSIATFTLADISFVLFRTKNGDVAIMEDVCPHLGGRLSDGDVIDNALRCPLHHFAYNTDGSLAKTGFDNVSSKACAHAWPCIDINGFIMMYYHPNGELPSEKPDTLNWENWGKHTVFIKDISAGVQTVSEGIADKAHINFVHGYTDVEITQPFDIQNEKLFTKYRFVTGQPISGDNALVHWLNKTLPLVMPVEFDYVACTMGYALTEVRIPALGATMRNFVNPMPINKDTARLFYSIAQGPINRERLHPFFKWMPNALLKHVQYMILRRGFIHDLNDDIKMWTNLTPLKSPSMCKADGPVNKYRRWAEQFYKT